MQAREGTPRTAPLISSRDRESVHNSRHFSRAQLPRLTTDADSPCKRILRAHRALVWKRDGPSRPRSSLLEIQHSAQSHVRTADGDAARQSRTVLAHCAGRVLRPPGLD